MGIQHDQAQTGLSRRELLTRSAVAGGIVWASPSLLGSVAGAQQDTCPRGSCPTLHIVKLENEENPIPTTDGGSNIDCSATYRDANGEPQPVFVDKSGSPDCNYNTSEFDVVATSCSTFNTHLALLENDPEGTGENVIRITLESGYQFVGGFSKKGSGDNCTGDLGGPARIDTTTCRTATFPSNSHIEFAYCGPN